MSKTRFVAFATQKGGIGKSTITALVANYFHNVKGYNVAVIDCDEPQYNLADLRDEELELIKSSDYFKAQACEHFKKLGKKSFSVTRSNAVNALDDAETVLNETEVKLDFIFFDMPGTIKSEGVMKTLSQMDYIFVPVSADRFVVESAMSFMQLFHDNFLTQGWSVTKKLAFFWTMVDKRERTSLYDVYEGMFKSLDYSVLNTRLPDSKRFRRELSENRKAVFRSTIFPSDPNLLRGSGIKELSDEICEIIKTWAYGKQKINTDAIDENLLIASIGKSKIGTTTASILDGASQNPVKDTEEKEEGEKKNPRSQMDKPAAPRKPSKVSSESYDAAFLKRNEIKTRQCVYISREIHKRISRIVSVLAKHELTVGGYIDLILERHLEENQEEINGLLRKEIDDWNVWQIKRNKHDNGKYIHDSFGCIQCLDYLFYNKLLLEVANNKEEEEKPPIDPMELVGKSLFKVSQLRKKEETVQKQTESEPVSENDVTFEDPPKNTARIPDELLDDVFTNVRIEDVGVKYSDDEDDADVPQAKGTSFEDIDTAVKTVKASKATDKEKRHAGKVFHEMDGNQFYEKFMENSKECKKNIHEFVTFYLQTHKIEEISKSKKVFKVPDSIEDFNILDFV